MKDSYRQTLRLRLRAKHLHRFNSHTRCYHDWYADERNMSFFCFRCCMRIPFYYGDPLPVVGYR